QEAVGEVMAGHIAFPHRYPQEKATAWPGRVQSHCLQALICVAPAIFEPRTNRFEVLAFLAQGRQRHLLTERRRERRLQRGGQSTGAEEMAAASQPAHPGRGQGVTLAETTNRQSPLTRQRQRADANVFPFVVIALKHLITVNQHVELVSPPS